MFVSVAVMVDVADDLVDFVTAVDVDVDLPYPVVAVVTAVEGNKLETVFTKRLSITLRVGLRYPKSDHTILRQTSQVKTPNLTWAAQVYCNYVYTF